VGEIGDGGGGAGGKQVPLRLRRFGMTSRLNG
jgi:hypothetical protein